MSWMFCLLLVLSGVCFAKDYEEEPPTAGVDFHSPVPYCLSNIVAEEFYMLKQGGQMMMDDRVITSEDRRQIMAVLHNVVTDHWRFHHLATSNIVIPGRQSFIQGVIRLHRVMDLGAHIGKLNDLFHRKFFPVFGLERNAEFEYHRMVFLHLQITQYTEGKIHMERQLMALERFLIIDSHPLDVSSFLSVMFNVHWLTHYAYWQRFEEAMMPFHATTLSQSKEKLFQLRREISG